MKEPSRTLFVANRDLVTLDVPLTSLNAAADARKNEALLPEVLGTDFFMPFVVALVVFRETLVLDCVVFGIKASVFPDLDWSHGYEKCQNKVVR